MLTALRRLRYKKLLPSISALEATYERETTTERIAAWQLERFNSLWADWRINVPFFEQLAKERHLPDRFECWGEIQDAVPVMGRHDLQRAGESLRNKGKPGDHWRTTGGSTAEPVQLPAWNSEKAVSATTMWYARGWFGVRPDDSVFMIWGHSHLLGRGLKGAANRFRRLAQDRALGYTRWSAYDLGEDALRRAGDSILDRKPSWLLGYSTALDRLARVNRDRGCSFRQLDLKLVVATAEAFPRTDSRDLMEEVFGCPVVMEYGAVETGVIAHQHPQRNGFQVLWQDHVVECNKAHLENDDGGELVVTSLFPRACPLVRYRLGDLIKPLPGTDPLVAFERVSGRCNDLVLLPDGRAIHSEAFAHVVKDCPAVTGYQIHQNTEGKIVFRYLSNGRGDAQTITEIQRRLRVIDPEFGQVHVLQVDSLEQTRAGKTQMVIRESRISRSK